MKRSVLDCVLQSCEYYGVGELLLYESNTARATEARTMAVNLAAKAGHSASAIERAMDMAGRSAFAIIGKPYDLLTEGIVAGNAVIYDVLDSRGVRDEGVGAWKRKRTMNEVALALMDCAWSPTTIEYQVGIPMSQILRAAELEGGLLDDGSIRFDKFSWLKQELTPVWVIGKYPGYTTNQPPMGEIMADKNHHYVWMERARYQIYKPSITRRFIDADKQEFDGDFHIGWAEGWD